MSDCSSLGSADRRMGMLGFLIVAYMKQRCAASLVAQTHSNCVNA